VCDGKGVPMMFCLTQGQASDYTGAKLLYPHLPKAKHLIGDKGYDSDEFRSALIAKGIEPCIPPRKKRKNPASYCKVLYKTRHKIENLFSLLSHLSHLKDWRRIATRYDRQAHTFFSAICFAASFIFYLKKI
jgi:transposase